MTILSVDEMLAVNTATWNQAAVDSDRPGSHLPFWGPYDVGADLSLPFQTLRGRRFLEVGCGNGRSIEYLLSKGATYVAGVDISPIQIEIANRRLGQRFSADRYDLFCQPMEQPLPTNEDIDMVFSVFGLGWALDLDRTLANIFRCLKRSAFLVFSWEHPAFKKTTWDGSRIVWEGSYFSPQPQMMESFRRVGPAYLATRQISEWLAALRRNGFSILDFVEPAPVEIREDNHPIHGNYYADEKARSVPCTMIFVCERN